MMSTRLQWRDREDRCLVQRSQRSKVEDAGLDAIRRKPFGNAEGDMDVCAVGNHRQIVAGARNAALPSGSGVGGASGSFCLIRGSR